MAKAASKTTVRHGSPKAVGDGSLLAVGRWRWEKPAVISILLIASVLHLVDLSGTPPGLQQDEAANAWNAWCLLKTGKDQVGEPYPIFYMRTLGENRTTPHIYMIMLFQAIGGMNAWTTRLPIALAGILTIPLLYYVAKRMFGVSVGFAAIVLLTFNPWAMVAHRQGVQVGLVPFIVAGVLAAMLWARLPLTQSAERPRPLLAGLAGLIAGAGCYGYFAVRMFIPILLFCIVLVSFRRWWDLLKTRRGALAVGAFLFGLAVTFGPLGWKQLTDPSMSKRGQALWAWSESDSTITKAGKVLGRYPEHFSPKFLFWKGAQALNHSVLGWGQFHWYSLPLMLVGLGAVVWGARRSLPCRILLILVILYPVGDLLARNPDPGPHAPRSLPGLVGLILLAGVGAVAGWQWFRRRPRGLQLPVAAAMGVAFVLLNACFLYNFFGKYRKMPELYHLYYADLQEACQWLRPQVDQFDAVLCTMQRMNQPYVMMLTHLQYDPQQWHADEKNVSTRGGFDHYFRFGKYFFLYPHKVKGMVERFTKNDRKDRVALIVRPGQFKGLQPAYVVRRPDGKAVLWVCDVMM